MKLWVAVARLCLAIHNFKWVTITYICNNLKPKHLKILMFNLSSLNLYCHLHPLQNYNVLVNKFDGNLRSKTPSSRKIKSVFRDIK